MKKFLSLCFLLCAFFFGEAFAYIPSEKEMRDARRFSLQTNSYIKRKPLEKRGEIMVDIFNRLQKRIVAYMEKNDFKNVYKLEYARRHLPGAEVIDTPDLLDDDEGGFTWTHAPNGFDFFYSAHETPTFGSFSDEGYSAFVNGSYFARLGDSFVPGVGQTNFHAGFLWRNGMEEGVFLSDDVQVTHTFCRTSGGVIKIISNEEFDHDAVTRDCILAFQTGPLIYALREGTEEKNFYTSAYIGKSHARTVIVVFEKKQPDGNVKQDLWFLTAYKHMTLKEVYEVVRTESRFAGTYDNLFILNLDGGSSVAYRSKAFPQLDFGKSKKLPIVFGIK